MQTRLPASVLAPWWYSAEEEQWIDWVGKYEQGTSTVGPATCLNIPYLEIPDCRMRAYHLNIPCLEYTWLQNEGMQTHGKFWREPKLGTISPKLKPLKESPLQAQNLHTFHTFCFQKSITYFFSFLEIQLLMFNLCPFNFWKERIVSTTFSVLDTAQQGVMQVNWMKTYGYSVSSNSLPSQN